MRKPVAAMVAATLMFASTTALAQEQFGTQGDAAVSVERLFGVHGTHVYEEIDVAHPSVPPGAPDEVQDDFIGLSFGWRGPVAPQHSPFDVPRLAFDYFIIDGLNVGGSIAYASGSDDTEEFTAGFLDAAGPSDYSAFLFAPRAGYAFMFSQYVGIWPRLGVTYHSFSVADVFSENGFALDIEAMFVLAPVHRFGILVGPTVDFDITGSRDYEIPGDYDADVKRTYRTIGLQIGLMTWL